MFYYSNHKLQQNKNKLLVTIYNVIIHQSWRIMVTVPILLKNTVQNSAITNFTGKNKIWIFNTV